VSWPVATLAVANVFQVCALAWIAAWQQRGAQRGRRIEHGVQELNGGPHERTSPTR
jgi:hypothetical protein